MNYFQCALERDNSAGGVQIVERLVGWIEERAAKVGNRVEIKGESGLWAVVTVGDKPIDGVALREKQAMDRKGMPDI